MQMNKIKGFEGTQFADHTAAAAEQRMTRGMDLARFYATSDIAAEATLSRPSAGAPGLK